MKAFWWFAALTASATSAIFVLGVRQIARADNEARHCADILLGVPIRNAASGQTVCFTKEVVLKVYKR